MKGLLNLLTVFAALLSLTTGCGLRSSGLARQGLAQLGTALATRHLAAGSAGGTLASAVGAALAGSRRGSLLGGLTRMSGGNLATSLLTAGTGITSSITTSGQGGAGRALLADLGNLAADRLRNRGSSGGILSGSTITGSAQQLGQGLQMASGFVMAAGATSSTATGFRTHLGGSSVANTVGQGAGVLPGGAVSGGIAPSEPGVSPGISPLEGVGPTAPRMGQASLVTTNAVTNSATTIMTQLGANSARNGLGLAAGPVAGALSGASGPGSSGVGTGPGVLPGVPGVSPGGDLLGGIGTTSPGGVVAPGSSGGSTFPANPGQVVGQAMRQTHQTVSHGLVRAVGTAVTAGTAATGNLGVNTVGNLLGRVPNMGDGVTHGGAPMQGSGLGSSGVGSGVTQGPEAQGALYGPGPGGALQNGNGALATLGLNDGSLSTGSVSGSNNLVSATSILAGRQQVRAQVLGGQQRSPMLGGTPRIGGGTAGNPAAGSGAQIGGSSRHNLLATVSSLSGGVSPGDALVVSPRGPTTSGVTSGVVRGAFGTLGGVDMDGRGFNGAIGSGPSGSAPGSGVPGGVNTGTVLGQSAQEISQAVGGGIFAPGATGGNPAPGLGVHPGRSPGQHLQGTATSVSSTSSFGATPSGTSSLSFSGTGSGGNLRQVSGQDTQPISHGPRQGSVVSVTTSRHSASSFHAQIVRHNQGHLDSALPGRESGRPGVGYPSGAIGQGTTGTEGGGGLLGTIVAASTGGGAASSPGSVPTVGLGGLNSNVATVVGSSGTMSGITQHNQIPKRRRIDGGTAAGIAIGSLASALAIGAIGAGIAGVINSGSGAGPRRAVGCSGGGCSSGCGRKRRSVPQSKVPAEALNNIPTNFDRLY